MLRRIASDLRKTFALVALAWAVGARAQAAAPGPLSQAHAALAGASGCARCHEKGGRAVASEACLSCHTALRRGIADQQGLHARQGYQACANCHREHQGSASRLVDWGKAGESAFDHSQTGFRLEGNHARLGCRQCHRAEAVHLGDSNFAAQADLGRTYLGLSRSCLSCHRDQHRGQFAANSCAGCHGQQSWTAPPRFDHGRTAFPLTGQHATVACARCHPAAATTDTDAPPTLQFKGVAHGGCIACHRDAHDGRLGQECSSCHDTTAWTEGSRAGFDHARTAFPLLGKHAKVPCGDCHGSGAEFHRPSFAACGDCHRDAHFGQFSARGTKPEAADCKRCHSVEGFRAATFDRPRHSATRFPLTGGHANVPCERCHAEMLVRDIADTAPDSPALARSRRFHFSTLGCAQCHASPHGDQFTPPGGDTPRSANCLPCHRNDSWHALEFRHNRDSRFALDAAHAKHSCSGCHRSEPTKTATMIRYKPLPVACTGCHPTVPGAPR